MVKGMQNLLLTDRCIVDELEFVDWSGRWWLLVALRLGRFLLLRLKLRLLCGELCCFGGTLLLLRDCDSTC